MSTETSPGDDPFAKQNGSLGSQDPVDGPSEQHAASPRRTETDEADSGRQDKEPAPSSLAEAQTLAPEASDKADPRVLWLSPREELPPEPEGESADRADDVQPQQPQEQEGEQKGELVAASSSSSSSEREEGEAEAKEGEATTTTMPQTQTESSQESSQDSAIAAPRRSSQPDPRADAGRSRSSSVSHAEKAVLEAMAAYAKKNPKKAKKYLDLPDVPDVSNKRKSKLWPFSKKGRSDSSGDSDSFHSSIDSPLHDDDHSVLSSSPPSHSHSHSHSHSSPSLSSSSSSSSSDLENGSSLSSTPSVPLSSSSQTEAAGSATSIATQTHSLSLSSSSSSLHGADVEGGETEGADHHHHAQHQIHQTLHTELDEEERERIKRRMTPVSSSPQQKTRSQKSDILAQSSVHGSLTSKKVRASVTSESPALRSSGAIETLVNKFGGGRSSKQRSSSQRTIVIEKIDTPRVDQYSQSPLDLASPSLSALSSSLSLTSSGGSPLSSDSEIVDPSSSSSSSSSCSSSISPRVLNPPSPEKTELPPIKLSQREMVLKEIVLTEREYVSDLNIIIDV